METKMTASAMQSKGSNKLGCEEGVSRDPGEHWGKAWEESPPTLTAGENLRLGDIFLFPMSSTDSVFIRNVTVSALHSFISLVLVVNSLK